MTKLWQLASHTPHCMLIRVLHGVGLQVPAFWVVVVTHIVMCTGVEWAQVELGVGQTWDKKKILVRVA